MKVQKNCMVTINYTLKDDSGDIVDTSVGKDPLCYMHGAGYLLPKLEERIEGLSEGESVHADLTPVEGYGEYAEQFAVDLPREQFEVEGDITVGMKFQAETPQGPAIVRVTKVSDSTVTVDGNHELAGKNLHFDVDVLEVRMATEQEIQMMESSCSCGGCGGGCGGDCGGNCGSSCGGCGSCS